MSTKKIASVSAILLVVAIIIVTQGDGNQTIDMEFDSFNMDNLYKVNYTDLPKTENVRIYPQSHVISDDEFKIVFENKRNKRLYWGADWRAEKWVDGEWVYWIPDNWAWTAEMRSLFPFSRKVDTFWFPFDDGLYRISKRCMLTDNYSRLRKLWVDEFTATFYLIKQSN